MERTLHPWNHDFAWPAPAGKPTTITAEQAWQYDERGFFVFEGAFDAALMDLARVKVGDKVNITVVPQSGAIMLMPLRQRSKKEITETIKKTSKDYRKTLRKLA